MKKVVFIYKVLKKDFDKNKIYSIFFKKSTQNKS